MVHQSHQWMQTHSDGLCEGLSIIYIIYITQQKQQDWPVETAKQLDSKHTWCRDEHLQDPDLDMLFGHCRGKDHPAWLTSTGHSPVQRISILPRVHVVSIASPLRVGGLQNLWMAWLELASDHIRYGPREPVISAEAKTIGFSGIVIDEAQKNLTHAICVAYLRSSFAAAAAFNAVYYIISAYKLYLISIARIHI